MGSDFRCSVGTVKSVGLEDHNKKGRAARYGEAHRRWDLIGDTGASRCERIFEKDKPRRKIAAPPWSRSENTAR